jgi:uncharacterized protein with ATP-grasp and redox domains
MNTHLECITCLARQMVEAASMATEDRDLREKAVRAALTRVSSLPYDTPPPHLGMEVHRIIKQCAGDADPYLRLKKKYNMKALEVYPLMKQKVRSSSDPLKTAVLLAIAGNIIDFGIQETDEAIHLEDIIEETLEKPFTIDHFGQLKQVLGEARRILYLTDNAGEIVFDRVLIEEIPERRSRVTVAVKGLPILNDATMEDADESGLTDIVKVIDNGSDAPGTILETCSPRFIDTLNSADMVISKGQGNYECLSARNHNTFFLLKAKCAVIARHLGVMQGDLVVKK